MDDRRTGSVVVKLCRRSRGTQLMLEHIARRVTSTQSKPAERGAVGTACLNWWPLYV